MMISTLFNFKPAEVQDAIDELNRALFLVNNPHILLRDLKDTIAKKLPDEFNAMTLGKIRSRVGFAAAVGSHVRGLMNDLAKFTANAEEEAHADNHAFDVAEEANRKACVADGGPLLPGYSLSLPNGTLIGTQTNPVALVAVRQTRRASFYEHERHAKDMVQTYRRDAVVIPYGWIYVDQLSRAALIKMQEDRK